MPPGDGQLEKVARHCFVRPGREDAIAVEVLIGIQILRRLLE